MLQAKFYYRDGIVWEGEYRETPHHPPKRKGFSKVLHREDGPAVEFTNGTKWWYLNGKRHRDDGPAVENYSYGWCCWYQNGKMLKILSKKYLIRYMELTGECLASLLLSPNKMLRESAKKYKWKEFNNAS